MKGEKQKECMRGHFSVYVLQYRKLRNKKSKQREPQEIEQKNAALIKQEVLWPNLPRWGSPTFGQLKHSHQLSNIFSYKHSTYRFELLQPPPPIRLATTYSNLIQTPLETSLIYSQEPYPRPSQQPPQESFNPTLPLSPYGNKIKSLCIPCISNSRYLATIMTPQPLD